MPAEQDEGCNVPAHEKHTNSHPDKGGTECIHITKVFRCEEKSVSSKRLHEAAVRYREQQDPEDQQYLVLPEVQKEQLHG